MERFRQVSAWRSVGTVVDFSGYYPGANPGCGGCGQHTKIHTFLVGPQVSVTCGRVTPFARFLVGETHMSTHIDDLPNYVTFTSNNSFAFGAGGGIDITLNRRISWRGQVDWLHNGFSTSDNQRMNEEVHNLAAALHRNCHSFLTVPLLYRTDASRPAGQRIY